MRRRLPPEPGFARREAKLQPQESSEEKGGSWGKHGFPHDDPMSSQPVVAGSFRVSASCSFAVSSSDSDVLMTLPPYCLSGLDGPVGRRLLDDHEERRRAGLDLVPDLLLKLLVDRLLTEVAEERSESRCSAVPSPG
jgi:hypothetical protein